MGRGPWIIAGGIVVAGLIVASTLWVLDLRQEPVAVNGPSASPTRKSPSPTPSPEPTDSASPTTPSPTPTEPPLRQARAVAATFYAAWVANDRATALTVGTQEAVQMAFLVPVRSRDSTRFERCSLNEDLGEDSYQCTVADRASDIVVLSMIARPIDGKMKIDEVIFHAD